MRRLFAMVASNGEELGLGWAGNRLPYGLCMRPACIYRVGRVCNDSLDSLWQSMNPTAFGSSFLIPHLYIRSIATEAYLTVDSTKRHLKNS
jgi:hypothetical protein